MQKTIPHCGIKCQLREWVKRSVAPDCGDNGSGCIVKAGEMRMKAQCVPALRRHFRPPQCSQARFSACPKPTRADAEILLSMKA
jgi:hypothetical protein